MNIPSLIKPKTVTLIKRLLTPLADEGLLSVPEQNEIVSQLRSLSNKGTLIPVTQPKLIDRREASELLGLGESNFRKLEKSGAFPFKRKMVGSAIRFRNLDIINYLLDTDDDNGE